ncbi:MAG: hypothetical protein J7K47_06650 [Thermoplasmata archaeon]|nr:hypothetical protein [Thermoplasmata archaeon]
MDIVEAINNFDPSHTTTFHGMQNEKEHIIY